MTLSQRYEGWKLSYSSQRPVTGAWVAESLGVELSAGSQDAVKRMVDQRIKDYPPDGHGGLREFFNG